MRPWQHARSSAGKNGDWTTDLPIHEFIDSTKAACPDLRHRMILHNSDLGADLTVLAFPDRHGVRDIMLRHVEEDLGCLPSLSDWLTLCEKSLWPRQPHRRENITFDEIVAKVAQIQGLKDETPLQKVLELLLKPTLYAGHEALPILFNGFGPAVVRSILGGPRVVAGKHSEKAVFDPAHAAEAIIYYYYGSIPQLSDIVAAVRRFPSKSTEAFSCKKIGTQN